MHAAVSLAIGLALLIVAVLLLFALLMLTPPRDEALERRTGDNRK